jgi:hypothetical protein
VIPEMVVEMDVQIVMSAATVTLRGDSRIVV